MESRGQVTQAGDGQVIVNKRMRWVLYNSAHNDGGSIASFLASSIEDLIRQVSDYWETRATDEDIADCKEVGWLAQNSDDYNEVVTFYSDGKIYVAVGGELHPYSPDDLD